MGFHFIALNFDMGGNVLMLQCKFWLLWARFDYGPSQGIGETL